MPTVLRNDELNIIFNAIVVCCCKLNNTRDINEHLFGQVSTCTGRYQLPIFCCSIVHPCEDKLAHNLAVLYFEDFMSYNLLTTPSSFPCGYPRLFDPPTIIVLLISL